MKVKSLRGALSVVAGAAALVALLGGFSSANAGSSAKGKKVELTFDLSKCEQRAPNLYKSPAVDKPICTKEFQQPEVECIRVGKKGNVFVMMPGGTVD